LTKRISGLRKERGLTQEELAAAVGLRQSTVAGWEAGKGPTLAGLVRLSDFYGVDLRWLATGDGEKKPRPVGEAERILAEIRRLLEARPSLGPAPAEGRLGDQSGAELAGFHDLASEDHAGRKRPAGGSNGE
jgi:transcriptional regulator with XRE-family HTH domain